MSKSEKLKKQAMIRHNKKLKRVKRKKSVVKKKTNVKVSNGVVQASAFNKSAWRDNCSAQKEHTKVFQKRIAGFDRSIWQPPESIGN